MTKRSAAEVKTELLSQIPVSLHPLVEEFDKYRRYAWSQYFRTQKQLDSLKAKKG